jgi:SnoaL-like protein
MSRLHAHIGTVLICLLTGRASKTDSAPPAGINQPEKKEIKDLLTRYYTDMSSRDWKKYRSYFWDSATITTAWQRPGDSAEKVNVITIDEFIRQTPNGPDSKPVFEERMTGADITVNNNLANVWADYQAKFGTKDSLVVWKGKDLFSIMRHRGEWKIISLSFEKE